MLQETLTHVSPLCDALESSIEHVHTPSIMEQASELVVWVQTLNTLFNVEPSNPRSAIKALDESIKSLQAVRKQVFSAVEQRVISGCLLYTSPSPRDRTRSRMPSSA